MSENAPSSESIFGEAISIESPEERAAYLGDEPVAAKPPTTGYRIRKFLRRHRGPALAGALVVVSLLAGFVGTSFALYSAWLQNRRVGQMNEELAEANEELTLKKKRLETALSELADALEAKTEALKQLAIVAFQEAVAKAIVGDDAGAHSALGMAEDLGISPSQVNVLKGLLAINSGENEAAITFAEQALAANPSGANGHQVGAKAILATAYLSLGHLHRWERELGDLRLMDPQSDTDYLLIAHALVLQNPEEAMAKLSAAPTMLRSPAGILIRSQRSLFTGIDKRDHRSIDEALRYSEIARVLLQDNTYTRMGRVIEGQDLLVKTGKPSLIFSISNGSNVLSRSRGVESSTHPDFPARTPMPKLPRPCPLRSKRAGVQ